MEETEACVEQTDRRSEDVHGSIDCGSNLLSLDRRDVTFKVVISFAKVHPPEGFYSLEDQINNQSLLTRIP